MFLKVTKNNEDTHEASRQYGIWMSHLIIIERINSGNTNDHCHWQLLPIVKLYLI